MKHQCQINMNSNTYMTKFYIYMPRVDRTKLLFLPVTIYVYIYIYMCVCAYIIIIIIINRDIGPAVRVFANGPGDLGSIPGRVIPKTLKMVLDTLSIIRYGSRVKWSNPGNGVAPSPTPWCSSYRKGSLRVTLDYIIIIIIIIII